MTLRTTLRRAALAAAMVGSLGSIASVAMLGAASSAVAGTTYTWFPTTLAAANWNDTTATGWNSGAGLYPGSGGDLTLGAVENDIANANTQAYTGSTSNTAANTANSTIHMNGVNAFLSEFDWGSTLNASAAPFWTIDGLGPTPGGSITFKALSGTATIFSDFVRSGRQVYITVPVAFASNTNVNLTPAVGATDYFGIDGAVTGAGNLTINTPGTTGGGVFFIDKDMSGYTGTINFDSTGTVSAGNDRIGLLPSVVDAHQTSLVLSGSSSLGKVGITTIELGALNGAGGNIHPYDDVVGPATLKVGYKNNATDTYNGVLSGSVAANAMSFEKAGTGTQVLGGNNTYTGNTTVSGGVLKLSGAGAINSTASINMKSGATFDVSGAVGGYTLPSVAALKGAGSVAGSVIAGGGNSIAPGDNGAGTLTVNGGLSLSSTPLDFDLSTTAGGANDKIAGVTNLSLAGTSNFTIHAPNGLGSGHYHLIDYNGTLTGDVSNLSYSNFTAGPRQNVFLSTTTVAKAVTLEVVGTLGNLVWKGNNGNNWDVGATVNWTGAVDNHFFDGDNVTFDDTATTFSPSVASTVQPLNVTFANTTAHAYTLSGSNAINVSNNMTLTGNGSVTFNNGSSIGVGGNLTNGPGQLTISNGGDFGVTGNFVQNASGTTTISNFGTFTGIGGSVTLNGTLNVNVAGNLTMGNTVTGSGTFNKQGANTVTLSGNNTGFTGAIAVAAGGTLKAGSHTALGALGATVTVANGATLDLNGYDLTKATVIAEGTGVGGTAGGLAASVAAAPGGSGAQHVYGLTLSNDLTITTGPAIMAIDDFNGFSPAGAFLHGNGKNLNVVTGGELDLINLGDTNLNNITVSGGGTLFLENNVTLGATGSLNLLDRGRVGLYLVTTPLSKPIVVAPASTVSELSTYASNNTVASPISIQGATLQANTRPVATGTTTLTLTGPITGSGGLELHDVSSSTARNGVVSLTSNGNTYAGTTLIGGGSAAGGTGIYNIDPAGDQLTLSLGNGGATGSLGAGDVTIGVASTLRFDRSAPITIPNNISGDGSLTVVNPTGVVTLTGSVTHLGTTTVSGGTLLVNTSSSGGGPVSVATGGTLGGTGSIISSLVTVDAGGSLAPGAAGIESLDIFGDTTINGMLKIEYQGTSIDLLNVNGTLDITNATLDAANIGTRTPGTYVFATYGALTGNFLNVPVGYSVDYAFGGGNNIALVVPAGIAGDYNANGVVDAADYVLWRKNPAAFGGTPAGYNTWRANFGSHLGSGSGLGSDAGSVPEPAGLMLMAFVIVGTFTSRGKR